MSLPPVWAVKEIGRNRELSRVGGVVHNRNLSLDSSSGISGLDSMYPSTIKPSAGSISAKKRGGPQPPKHLSLWEMMRWDFRAHSLARKSSAACLILG